MHGTASQSYILKVNHSISLVYIIAKNPDIKKKERKRKKNLANDNNNIKPKNIYITHDTVKYPPSFKTSVSNTGVVGKSGAQVKTGDCFTPSRNIVALLKRVGAGICLVELYSKVLGILNSYIAI